MFYLDFTFHCGDLPGAFYVGVVYIVDHNDVYNIKKQEFYTCRTDHGLHPGLEVNIQVSLVGVTGPVTKILMHSGAMTT